METQSIGKVKVLNTSALKAQARKAKAIDLNTLTADELFLHALKQIGKPAIVRDMVKELKKDESLKTEEAKLLIKLYASASLLNKVGFVKREPVNKSMFVYGMSGWKFGKAKETKVA